MTGATVKLGATSLMYACQQGKESQVYEIIKSKPATVLERERSLKTALHYCAESGEGGVESAAALLRAAPELVYAQDQDGYTALHLAVIAGNVQLAKFLIAHGADVNTPDNEGHTCAHWATVCGEMECLELILAKGGDPNRGDMHGGCPLHYAAQMCGPGSEMPADRRLGMAALRLLIDNAANPNIPDHHGRQPILWAASAGSSEAILVLTNAGANVEAADKDGLTALHCAASRGHTDCVETLVSLCNAEADVIDNNGCSALFYAVTLGHADCTQALLNHGANTNRQDRKGRTAMHCGAAKGQMETLKVVWSRGGNLWSRTARGDYPLHEAVTSGRCDLVSWLLSLRPDTVNSPNNDGRCPLHLAAIHNNIDMCKVLLDAGSLVNPVMRTGKGLLATPLDASLHKGHRGAAKYLQLHGGVPAARLNSESAALRGPRNAGAQSQKPNENEKENIQEHLSHTKSPGVSKEQKVTFPSQKQKILQVYVEDGVMIKKINYPQGLDDERVRRRRRKRKSRQAAGDRTPLGDKDRFRKGEDYEDSTDEGDTSQTSSFLESRLVTDSESEARKNLNSRSSINLDDSTTKAASHPSPSPSPDKKINVERVEHEHLLDGHESGELKKQIHKVVVELHSPFTPLERDADDIKNVPDSLQFKENEASEVPHSLSFVQSSEDKTSDSTQQKKNENEESTQSDVTIIEQNTEVRKRSSINDAKDSATSDEETPPIPEYAEDEAPRPDEADVSKEEGEVITAKDSPGHKSNIEVEKSEITYETEHSHEHYTEEKEDTGESEVITPGNYPEVPLLTEATDNTHDEPGETQELEPHAELYDSLEDDTLTAATSAESNELNKKSRIHINKAAGNWEDNILISDEEEPQNNLDYQTSEVFKANEGAKTEIQEKINEAGQLVKDNLEETQISGIAVDNGEHEEQDYIKESNLNEVEQNGDLSYHRKEEAMEPTEIEPSNKEINVLELKKEKETTSQNDLGKRHKSNDENAIGDIDRYDRGLIKVLDEENVLSPSNGIKSKPKRKEWKRQESREKWEPHAVSPEPDENESGRKSPYDSGIGPSPHKELKNGIKGIRPKSKSRIPRMCNKRQREFEDDISTVSVTQAVQYSVRKYHLERRIFHQLLELKRLQIRSGRASEGVLVKRLVDDYRRAGLMLGLQQYNGVYTFRAFERYLYDQLRLLQSSEKRIIPRLKSSDDLERLNSALRKSRAGQDILTNVPNNPALCTYQTHRCHHATHAYTGIPCAAYIRRDHHTMPKTGSFLPKLVNGQRTGDIAKTLRFVDPTRPLTLELSHGSEKQVITLPTEKLDKSKRYFVTFTIKSGNQKKMEENQGHTHASSV